MRYEKDDRFQETSVASDCKGDIVLNLWADDIFNIYLICEWNDTTISHAEALDWLRTWFIIIEWRGQTTYKYRAKDTYDMRPWNQWTHVITESAKNFTCKHWVSREHVTQPSKEFSTSHSPQQWIHAAHLIHLHKQCRISHTSTQAMLHISYIYRSNDTHLIKFWLSDTNLCFGTFWVWGHARQDGWKLREHFGLSHTISGATPSSR